MEELNIKDILKILNRGKWLIIILTIVGLLAGYIFNSKYTTPLYEATTKIILSAKEDELAEILGSVGYTSKNGPKDEISSDELTLNEKLVNTYTEIIKSESVMDRVIQNLNLKLTTKQLISNVTVTQENESAVLKVRVKAKDAETSTKIAAEITKVFFQRIEELYNITSAKVLDEPKINETPVNISPIKYSAIGAAIGLALSLGILLVIYMLNDNIKSEEDIEKGTKLPVLASIGRFSSKTPLVCLKRNNAYSESYRCLISNLNFYNKQTILITSNDAGEGKSITASNLAITYANSGKKTLLIDADMRRGTQNLLFKIPNTSGLSNLIKQDSVGQFDKVVVNSVIHNLDILTKGTATLNFSELLFSDYMHELLSLAKEKYDYIVIDGTPSSLVSDDSAYLKDVDATIVVIKYNNTSCYDINKMKAKIERSGGEILGTVLNNVPRHADNYSKYYYYGDSNAMVTKH